jgi:hypothetical protein
MTNLENKINKNCIWYVTYKNITSTTGQGMKMALLKNKAYSNLTGVLKYRCDNCKGYKEKCKAYLPID